MGPGGSKQPKRARIEERKVEGNCREAHVITVKRRVATDFAEVNVSVSPPMQIGIIYSECRVQAR
jgi:hypothetical protein